MTDMVDCVVVGAGVIGLAVARQLALDGHETLLVERQEAFGTGTSSRHSEVIHAGIYYPAGSLKAQLCVRGRELLYAYCAARGIDHRRCGKLIVATQPGQLADLERIAAAARRNGVEDLYPVGRDEALRLEPSLQCVAALVSPSTALRPVDGAVELWVSEEPQPLLKARWVVNCAGLHAPELARRIEDFPAAQVPRAWYAKGNYFTLAGRAPFSRLIYPVPEPGGLGVHLTLDLGGQARFGPDVEWIDALDYSVDPRRSGQFYAAIRAYWPQLRDGQLTPAYAGIRPKISGPGEPVADFRIDGPAVHGVAGIVNLFGIESPGLTASLAIAERVGEIVAGA